MITVGKLKYDPNNTLGRGSFGTVFRGVYVYLEGSFFRSAKSTPVAVKRVEKDIVNESIFRREEQIMEKVSNHPNILNYIHTEMNAEFMYVYNFEVCVIYLKSINS